MKFEVFRLKAGKGLCLRVNSKLSARSRVDKDVRKKHQSLRSPTRRRGGPKPSRRRRQTSTTARRKASCNPGFASSFRWVAAKGFKLTYHNPEAIYDLPDIHIMVI